MGIPKFFRFMSQRYPLISQVIDSDQIPEFDNLYLDMNGIVHTNSHPNDADATFRLTEEQIFLAIFQYIDHIFATIRPKKVFFMAIDGVAPRAKMNQQRSRRFRSAKEAEAAIKQAVQQGKDIPKEPAFDSNCITPGTPFMVRLHEQLQYFIHKKISEDALWRGVKVILSGHETPGEGEHKIMDYIRHAKAQPGYEPNQRHCLYGLDADLIILGLTTHEPHFSLLREEVIFGSRSKSKQVAPAIPGPPKFFLMHLSLFREYVVSEFAHLQALLPDTYDPERIIDDVILMSFLIGNDFLPHLPGFDIVTGAFNTLFRAYSDYLQETQQYLHHNGVLSIDHFENFVARLANVDHEQFMEELGSQMESVFANEKEFRERSSSSSQRNKSTVLGALDESQRKVLNIVTHFVQNRAQDQELVFPPHSLHARDRAFLMEVAVDLGIVYETVPVRVESSKHMDEAVRLSWETDYDLSDDETLTQINHTLSKYRVRMGLDDEDDDEDDEDAQADSKKANQEAAALAEQAAIREEEARLAQFAADKKDQERKWVLNHYASKFKFPADSIEADIREVIRHYVTGIKWVLEYYYCGVPSWSWFYPYHYAPRLCSINNLAALTLHYETDAPFLPLEQLMAVLPASSGNLVPEPLRHLMTSEQSPIHHFYPQHFAQVREPGKAEWEAIVMIPFIDAKLLLQTIRPLYHKLTDDERQRNVHGPALSFRCDMESTLPIYKAPQYFPDVRPCRCVMQHHTLGKLAHPRFGLIPGTFTGNKMLPGFPSFDYIPHVARLKMASLRVFERENTSLSVVIQLDSPYTRMSTEAVAKVLLRKHVYGRFPFLRECKVTAVQDMHSMYSRAKGEKDVFSDAPDQTSASNFNRNINSVKYVYEKQYGMQLGPVDCLVHVKFLKGMRIKADGSLRKEWENDTTTLPVQLIVSEVARPDPRFLETKPMPLTSLFPVGDAAFVITASNYGKHAIIEHIDSDAGTADVALVIPPGATLSEALVNQRLPQIITAMQDDGSYVPSHVVARQLRISNSVLARITSSFHVRCKKLDKSYNIGLCLKYEARGLRVLGYSRKTDAGWEFSNKAVELIATYMEEFPHLFAALYHVPHSSYLSDDKLFPNGSGPNELMSISSFMRQHKIDKLETNPVEADVLSKEQIQQLQTQIDMWRDDAAKEVPKDTAPAPKQSIKNVPVTHLLSYKQAVFRLAKQTFRIGDRVVKVVPEGPLVVGTRGTVIATQAKVIHVLLDAPTMGGSDLDSRCAPFHGAILPTHVVLNLSFAQIGPSADLFESGSVVRPRPTPVVRGYRRTQYTIATQPSPRHAGRAPPPAPPRPLGVSYAKASGGSAATSRPGSSATPTSVFNQRGNVAMETLLSGLATTAPRPATHMPAPAPAPAPAALAPKPAWTTQPSAIAQKPAAPPKPAAAAPSIAAASAGSVGASQEVAAKPSKSKRKPKPKAAAQPDGATAPASATGSKPASAKTSPKPKNKNKSKAKMDADKKPAASGAAPPATAATAPEGAAPAKLSQRQKQKQKRENRPTPNAHPSAEGRGAAGQAEGPAKGSDHWTRLEKLLQSTPASAPPAPAATASAPSGPVVVPAHQVSMLPQAMPVMPQGMPPMGPAYSAYPPAMMMYPTHPGMPPMGGSYAMPSMPPMGPGYAGPPVPVAAPLAPTGSVGTGAAPANAGAPKVTPARSGGSLAGSSPYGYFGATTTNPPNQTAVTNLLLQTVKNKQT